MKLWRAIIEAMRNARANRFDLKERGRGYLRTWPKFIVDAEAQKLFDDRKRRDKDVRLDMSHMTRGHRPVKFKNIDPIFTCDDNPEKPA